MRRLGLVIAAMMAVAAFLGTTAASAEIPGAFTTNKVGNPLVTSKVTEHVLTITGSNMTCNKISFEGVAEAATKRSQTFKPQYEECTLFGFANGTVNTAECSYTFTATTTGNPSSTSETHASLDIANCTAGGIVWTINVPFIAKCKVFIPNQEVKDAVHYTNVTDPKSERTDIVIDTTMKSIEAQVQESTGACPLTVGTHKNMAYTGQQTVRVEGGNLSYDKDHTP